MTPEPSLSGRRLLSGQYLATNEYINSENWSYFAIMQDDGHFCVYQGTGPGDNRGLIWCTDVVGEIGSYVALMQGDGNFGVYRGTSLKDIHDVLWHAEAPHAGSYFQLKIQDDGNLVLAETWDADVRDKTYWNCGTIAEALPPYQIDQSCSQSKASSYAPIWQSFTPSRSGDLAALDLMLYSFATQKENEPAILSIHAGEGQEGPLLARQVVSVPPIGPPPHPFQHYVLDKPPFLSAGAIYSIEVHSDEMPRGPYIGLASSGDYSRGKCSLASSTLVFRTCMRTRQPEWNHPVG